MLAAALTGCEREVRYAGERMDPSLVAPDVVLSGAGDTRVSLARPAGRVTLVTFGYTSCPDICPTTLSDWRRVRAALGADTTHVRFVFVSADWRRDRPAGVTEFVGHFDPTFLGVTADSVTLLRILPLFQAQAVYEPAPGGEGYRFGHSANSYLLDDTGRIVVLFPFTTAPDLIVRDIRRMLDARHLGRR